jgi:hypothetical protein
MSATVRAWGPAWSNKAEIGTHARVEYRPVVGLKPTIPQNAAGTRIDPSVSSAIPNGASRAAIAAAVPPLLPPGIRDRSYGLWTAPNARLLLVQPWHRPRAARRPAAHLPAV